MLTLSSGGRGGDTCPTTEKPEAVRWLGGSASLEGEWRSERLLQAEAPVHAGTGHHLRMTL